MSDIRIPQIIEKRIEGKNQGQIATELGVSPMTIYRDKQTDLYQSLVNEFIQLYINKIKEFVKSGVATTELEGVKEMGRMLRTGITRQTKHTEDVNIRARITITERRKRTDELLKVLELTPDQYRVLGENVESEHPENLE